MPYEERRTQFLATIAPGDLVSLTTFDGSSVHEVYKVTDDEVVLCRQGGGAGVRWPRSGVVHRDYYGGFDERIGPPSDTQREYFLRRQYRAKLTTSTKKMDAADLERVADFADHVAAGHPTLTAAQLVQIADLLDAGEEAFRALERITGRPAPLSGGSEVQDALRAMAAADELSNREEIESE